MFPGVKAVKVLPEYKLLLIFDNDESKIFDVNPYLETGLFKQLKSDNNFSKVRVSFDTIEWDIGLDICPEVLYEKSIVYDAS